MKLVVLLRGVLGLRTASRWRRAVATATLVLAAMVVVAAQAEAATFTVGSTADTGGCTKPPTGTTCTLRQLVNSVPAGSTIDVPANASPYSLTAGELLIEKNLTIAGDSAWTTQLEQQTSTADARIFDVQPDPTTGAAPTVVISGLDMFFGKAVKGSANGNIGGNVLNEGTLTLSEDQITNGQTTGGEGSGVANVGGTLTITHSLVESNLGFGAGGTGGSAAGVDNVALRDQTAQTSIDNSTIISNTAASGVTAAVGGGGISTRCTVCTSSTVTVTNSTIADNDGGTATANAGGLVAGTGSSISIRNSIVAGNTISSDATASNCAGSITSLGHNIEDASDCGFKQSTDFQNTDPGFLDGLHDNGGNSATLALSATSPAIDAIPAKTTGCGGTDQRDIPRPQGSACDIGAFELMQAVEGASFTGVIGSVQARSTPTIDWGDGTAQSNGTVDPNTGQVTGTHTYAEAGIYHGLIHFLNSDGKPATLPFDFKVTDAPLSASATPVSAVAGSSFSGTVATFGDGNPLAQATDFTATIDWGDGSAVTAGSIATNAGGGFKVSGTHTYTKTGSFSTTITIADVGGSSATANGTATVSPPQPAVTSVNPTAGPTAGATSVTITGTNLTGATAVKFGATNATNFTVNTATSITATAPAGSAATVDITVTTAGGTSATSANDQFRYAALPTVTSINPTAGPTAGATSVTITGTNLTGATAVKFGATNATNFTVNTATSITATAPAGSAATVDITVTTAGGTSATSANDQFRYAALPTVTSINPTAGPTAGATSVTITGTNLTGATAVKFGATNATNFTVNTATSITATAPAGSAATVDITVTTAGGTSATSVNDRYTYVAAATVSSVTPSAGPIGGGTTVTIGGTNLLSATAVKFGANAATIQSNTATQIVATNPAGSAGTVDVTVATAGGTSATNANDHFTYAAAPTITSISPTAGPTAGGTSVTITGTNLANASAVNFGASGTTITNNSATQIVATSPTHAAGAVDVTVTTAGGTSGTSAADRFTYAALPTVTSISPTAGVAAGGTSVTITGTNLANASAVTFGASVATITSNSATQIVATNPGGSGTVHVTVTTPGGTSTTSASDQFTYAAIPAVTSLAPTAGPLSGGTSVTITGTDLGLATAVKFGANAATSFTVNSATQITVTAPSAVLAAAVDVIVTTPGGSSSPGAGDKYTYTNGPSVATISPSSGPTAGGTSVTITGANLANATRVKFGNNAATIQSNTSTQIVATSPVGSGTVHVVVTTAGGPSATSAADQFTYAGPPTVTGVSPSSGTTLGGTVVTITGTNLANPSAVKFGGSNATVVTPISATQIVATSPPASAGAQDVRVTTPGGTSAMGSADRFTFVPPPTVTSINPSSGPGAGGTSVTITGTTFTGTTAVQFGSTAASNFKVDSDTQITAVSPAGSGVADVKVTTPNGTSATSAGDQFTYTVARTNLPPPGGTPSVLTGAPSVKSSSGAALEGSVNPQGLTTTAHFEYGLDSRFRAAGPTYDQSTASQSVGSDFSSHAVTASLTGLVPNALYHVRLVATNSAGTTFGPDATFTTKSDPPPTQPPLLGSSFDVQPVKGIVFIEINGKFIPITEVREIPNGAVINALRGTITLFTATGPTGPRSVAQTARANHKTKGKKKSTKSPSQQTQKGTFGGAVFRVTQDHSGLTTLALVSNAFKGAPSFASCTTKHAGRATIAALSKKTLQLLQGSDNHGKFRTKGRYAAATTRGTVWSVADRCDGTLTKVSKDSVLVNDFVRRITITVRAGHSYLALARPPGHK